MAIADNATPIDLQVTAAAPQRRRGAPPPPDTEELVIVTASLNVCDTGWVIQAATIQRCRGNCCPGPWYQVSIPDGDVAAARAARSSRAVAEHCSGKSAACGGQIF
jgi:hypothetical protein